MEAIEWTLATSVGILLLLVLMLGLLAIGVWLLRFICRVWNDSAPASSHEQNPPSARAGGEADA
jgi:hypothetical protein